MKCHSGMSKLKPGAKLLIFMPSEQYLIVGILHQPHCLPAARRTERRTAICQPCSHGIQKNGPIMFFMR